MKTFSRDRNPTQFVGLVWAWHIYYVYMSSDGPHKRDSPFWRHSPVRFTCLQVIRRLVNKGLYGVGKHVCWCTDFTNSAIAVHAFQELGAVTYGSCCTL